MAYVKKIIDNNFEKIDLVKELITFLILKLAKNLVFFNFLLFFIIENLF